MQIHNRKAFTILEIMIVMSLVGVVASIATVNFSATVNRMKYNDYVRRVFSVFSQARTQAIMTNSTQRVVCSFGAQRIERRGQKINASRTGYDEIVQQKLTIPLLICTIEQSKNSDSTLTSKKSKGGSYVFLPDGLGNEYKPLEIDIVQGEKLKKQLFWKLRRDNRGRVLLLGPEKVQK